MDHLKNIWAEYGNSPATLTILGATLTLCVAISLLLLPSKTGDSIEISQLYVYPVKALRGSALQKAHIGEYGMVGDRTFSLQRVHRDADHPEKPPRYETMLAGYYLQLALFRATIEHEGNRENSVDGQVVVTWCGRNTEFDTAKDITTPDKIQFPLKPDVAGRKSFETSLHGSTAMAFDMGDELSQWFSDRTGMEIRLVFIGDGSRPVLGPTMAPNSKGGLSKRRILDRVKGFLPFFTFPAERLVFNDIAHYLVVTEESNDALTAKLEDGCEMDVTKFRPNIVLKGASAPWVEDYWGEVTFDGGIQMPLMANCYRCQSITVDYDTGKTATDDRGMAWKKLNKDRRVDKGAKYSPVFGRYGYCFGSSTGKTVEIGQKGKVTHINEQRTTFDWPHLTGFGLTQ